MPLGPTAAGGRAGEATAAGFTGATALGLATATAAVAEAIALLGVGGAVGEAGLAVALGEGGIAVAVGGRVVLVAPAATGDCTAAAGCSAVGDGVAVAGAGAMMKRNSNDTTRARMITATNARAGTKPGECCEPLGEASPSPGTILSSCVVAAGLWWTWTNREPIRPWMEKYCPKV